MQTPKKERTQKQLSQPGNLPATNPPQNLQYFLEREILLSKIESLKYSLREQKSVNARLKEKSKMAEDEIDLMECIIQQQIHAIAGYSLRYKELVQAYLTCDERLLELCTIITSLTEGHEWKPQVKEIINTLKAPVNLN